MSPAATMDESQVGDAVDRAADELFYKHGVVGVSMAQIRDLSGVSMRRIYVLCPSKADVISRWLRYRHLTWMAGFTHAVEQHLAAGDNGVVAIFSALESWMTEINFGGCGFINTRAERSELTADHTRIIQDHKRSLAEYLGSLTSHGVVLAVLVDGAIVQASIFGNVEPIRAAQVAANALIEQHAA